jgi:hypothetical protein
MLIEETSGFALDPAVHVSPQDRASLEPLQSYYTRSQGPVCRPLLPTVAKQAVSQLGRMLS